MKRNNLPFPLDGVFIDSYATYFPDDQQQQEAFARETSKLWDFFSTKEKFVFKSIQDILDALYKCEKETVLNALFSLTLKYLIVAYTRLFIF